MLIAMASNSILNACLSVEGIYLIAPLKDSEICLLNTFGVYTVAFLVEGSNTAISLDGFLGGKAGMVIRHT